MRLQQMIIGMMLLLSFGVSQAGEARHYFGVHNESYSIDGLDGISYRYGYDFSNLISMEIDYSETNLAAPTTDVLTVDSITNLMFHFNKRYESVTMYFALGYGTAAMTQLGHPWREAFNGPAYGVGIELYGSKNTAVSFSWLRRFQAEEDPNVPIPVREVDAVQIGLVHHFDFGKTISRY
ncbi:MAG: hypothetical protein KAU21_12535 [Gammaproteobacteria bacterium]|nr:hypothetical protein [Gammaproteobacteria bacterium]